MNAVTTTTEIGAVAAVDQGRQLAVSRPDDAALLAVISRAASDPSIDIEKMERLLALQERMVAKTAEAAFNEAMSGAQSEMRPISADATNPQTRSRYATYAKLDSAVRPIYTKHGFALSFDTGEAQRPDEVRVLCYVSHRSGHSRTYKVDMPADGKGARGGDVMTRTHAMGAGMSYGSRYLLKLIFNIAVGEDDTDGNPPCRDTEPRHLDESAVADHLAAIESATNGGELKRAWANAEIAAKTVGDAASLEKFAVAVKRKTDAAKEKQGAPK